MPLMTNAVDKALGLFNLKRAAAKPGTKDTKTNNGKPTGKAPNSKTKPAEPVDTATSPPPTLQSVPMPTSKAAPARSAGTLSPRKAPTPLMELPLPAPAARASDAMQIPRTTPNAAEVEQLKAYTGKALSAPEVVNELTFDQEERKSCALLENGTLLRNVNGPFKQAVLSATAKIRRLGLPVREEMLVDPSVIRYFYERETNRAPTISARIAGPDQKQLVDFSPQQRLFMQMLREGESLGASDMRIYIGSKEAKLAFRIGGAIRAIREYDAAEMRAVFAAIFNLVSDVKNNYDRNIVTQGFLAAADIEPISPRWEGARMQFAPAGRDAAFLSCRMVTQDKSASISIKKLGYSRIHEEMLDSIQRLPHGVIYITGPTGSGKSTTLMVCIEETAVRTAGEASILTAEDPAEFQLRHDIIQFSVQGSEDPEKRRQAFVSIIRSMLRSDPDIILIGEVREEESSDLVIKAATTGHLVWTTMHTNDVKSIFPRLRGLDAKDYDIFNPQLTAAGVAQRLTTITCPDCSLTWNQVQSSLNETTRKRYLHILGHREGLLDGIRFRNPAGCNRDLVLKNIAAGLPECNRGSIGRTVCAEILRPDQLFMDLMQKDIAAAEEHWLTKLNGSTMPEHGLYKIFKGLCDPRDVENRVGDLTQVSPHRYETLVERCGEIGETLDSIISQNLQIAA